MLKKNGLPIGAAICFLVGLFAITTNDSASAAPACLASPNRESGPGTHWHYRVNQATKQRCWYLKKLGGSSRPRPTGVTRATPASATRTAPAAAPATAPATAARAAPAEVAAPAESEFVNQGVVHGDIQRPVGVERDELKQREARAERTGACAQAAEQFRGTLGTGQGGPSTAAILVCAGRGGGRRQ